MQQAAKASTANTSQQAGEDGTRSQAQGSCKQHSGKKTKMESTDAARHFEDEPAAGLCVGTLRWDASARFPPLSAWPSVAPTPHRPFALTDWRSYVEARFEPDAHGTIRLDPLALDGLSYPLSLLRALQVLRLRPPSPGPLNLLVIGASSKAEERVWRESNYWQELQHFLPATHLYFVGPEISADRHRVVDERSATLRATSYKGTVGQLLEEESHLTPANSVVVGFNTGMGSGLWPLMKSWLPDLLLLVRSRFVAIFTCANDWSDLRGEVEVFKTLHAHFALKPQRNPFKAATIVHEPGDGPRSEWSCSSCFVYAVHGCEDGGPMPPAPGSASSVGALRRKLKRFAQSHLQTQTPSPMP